MVWGIATICLILTIMLLSGKCSFLISGYNILNKAEKSKYDEKKLCLVVGSGIGVITALLFMLACFGTSQMWMMFAVPIVTITVPLTIFILGNTVCKVKKVDTTELVDDDESKRNKRITKVALIFTAVILLIVAIFLSTGQIEITVAGNSMAIDGSYWEDYKVHFDSVKTISYIENLEVGRRTNGMRNFKLLEGNFRNDEFGDYVLYAYLRCESYIVFDTFDGFVVINAETQEKTQSLYDMLKNEIS